MIDCAEPNYRTDEQLQTILARSGKRVPISPYEQIRWLSANLERVVGLVDDPAQSEQLKKIVAGFDVPPIKESPSSAIAVSRRI